jgi:hypothetical protein
LLHSIPHRIARWRSDVGTKRISNGSNRRYSCSFAQKAVVLALDYKQGDRESLMDAQEDFTAAGWSEFMKRMDGWLDDKGAPLSSESFHSSGDTVVKSRENGIIHLSIPGTLKQSQNKSSTTYRVVVDVQLGGEPIRIEHLELTTGGGTARRDL